MPRVAGVWGKLEVEECHALTIGPLVRYTGLRPGFSGTVRWLRGAREIGSIGYTVLTGDRLHLHYSSNDRPYDVLVHLCYSALVSGGRWPWWTCPACGRRCGVLYLRCGAFACRCCHDLVYASQHTRMRKGMDWFEELATFADGRALLADVAADVAKQLARSGPDPTPIRPRGRPCTRRRYTRRPLPAD